MEASLSRTWSPAPSYRPPSLEGAGRHTCGCQSHSTSRLQSASGELRAAAASADKGDPFELVLDLALIGGGAYLVYELFFGE